MSDRELRLSVRRLADEFGIARETVTRRLAEARVEPAGTRQGHPVYRLRDAAPALVGVYATPAAEVDPRQLPPAQRRAYYLAENARIEFEEREGRLVPADEARDVLVHFGKSVAEFLGTLADILERDCGLTPEATAAVQDRVDQFRDQLYAELVREGVEVDDGRE